MRRVNATSSFREGLYIADSKIHGKGLFTTGSINKFEIVVVFGGAVFDENDLLNGKCDPKTTIAISETEWLGNLNGSEKELDDYINHSCMPNVGMLDNLSLCAIKDIGAGEEIVADYSIWVNSQDYLLTENCCCGASNCRGRVSGNDWLRLDVIYNSLNYFSPFLNKRIEQQLKMVCKDVKQSR